MVDMNISCLVIGRFGVDFQVGQVVLLSRGEMTIVGPREEFSGLLRHETLAANYSTASAFSSFSQP
jgi:hypothetical protein